MGKYLKWIRDVAVSGFLVYWLGRMNLYTWKLVYGELEQLPFCQPEEWFIILLGSLMLIMLFMMAFLASLWVLVSRVLGKDPFKEEEKSGG